MTICNKDDVESEASKVVIDNKGTAHESSQEVFKDNLNNEKDDKLNSAIGSDGKEKEVLSSSRDTYEIA